MEHREEDIFVLTETKNSEGCNYIADYFFQYGYSMLTSDSTITYNVSFPKSETGDLGVMIISKLPITHTFSFFDKPNIYYPRLLEADITYGDTSVHIMGMYVPSRDRTEKKIQRKKTFISETMKRIRHLNKKNSIILGDFNVLEKSHVPKYNTFFGWEYDFYSDFYKYNYFDTFRLIHPDKNEYSWVGRTNNGYRYDHCFASSDFIERINNCYYIHESRELSLTDHSAMTLDFN